MKLVIVDIHVHLSSCRMKLVIVDMCPPFSLSLCQNISTLLLKECAMCVYSRAPTAVMLACLGVHYEVREGLL